MAFTNAAQKPLEQAEGVERWIDHLALIRSLGEAYRQDVIVIMSARGSEFNFTANKFNSFCQLTHFLTGVVRSEIAFVTH